MGAGQSKQPPPPLSSRPLAAPASPADDSPHSSSSSSTTTTVEGGGGGGGCPMKNSDGSYRMMPGFGSLFGKMGMAAGQHPPVDRSKVDAINAEVAASASAAPPATPAAVVTSPAASGGGGCPVKHDVAGGSTASSSRSWGILRRSGPGPGSDGLAKAGNDDNDTVVPVRYDVYSRPLPMDPTNNMPVSDPSVAARNLLPSPGQNVALPTERASSSIPKGGGEATKETETWTYPSPQMFYNALARKGKLDPETKEEDMISVVAIHNVMNEGTWERILKWERVLNPPPSSDFDGSYGKSGKDGDNASEDKKAAVVSPPAPPPGPSLTKFMGRPTDLSPKAAFKHYVLGHPLPFDRHDWTVSRPVPDGKSYEDVRYVIDYYHDDDAAREDEGSGLPNMDDGIGEGGRIRSLLVDVRPAADSFGEIWGRMVTMPLARRGCRSMLECLLFKGQGSGVKADFEPLPLAPSGSLKKSLGESEEVWADIQKDAAMKKGVGPQDRTGDDRKVQDDVVGANQGGGEEEQITESQAVEMANVFSNILSECREAKMALSTCSSEDECRDAFTKMTICAGGRMCPLQHSSLLHSLEGAESIASRSTAGKKEEEEAAEARVNLAFEVLGECVANYDSRAGAAKQKFPDVFDEALKKGGK